MIAQTVFDALDELEGLVEDEFVTEQVTVAFDSEDTETKDVQVARGDWRSYYNAYDYVIMLGEGDTIDSIEQEIERIDFERDAREMRC